MENSESSVFNTTSKVIRLSQDDLPSLPVVLATSPIIYQSLSLLLPSLYSYCIYCSLMSLHSISSSFTMNFSEEY